MYNLVVETEYVFFDVPDDETFHIAREKTRLSLNASYDRLFLFATNASCLSEKNKVLAEEKIKKAFYNSWLRRVFFFSPLENSTGVFFLWLIAGIALTYFFGWRVSVVYFPLAYLLLVSFNWLLAKFVTFIGKKAFDLEDEKKEFYRFFQSDYLKAYYQNNERTAFMGDVETD